MAEQDLNKEIQNINNNKSINEQVLAKYDQPFLRNGFIVADNNRADNSGLPYTKTPSNKSTTKFKRNIIHWFIPQMGVVKMFVNPSGISYKFDKNIVSQQTKGGFSLQYLGEKLPQLTIRGTTGTSGIEGINVLYELYRAEQYVFDNVGLLLAASNAGPSTGQQLAGLTGEGLGQLIGGSSENRGTNSMLASQAMGSIFGTNTAANLSTFTMANVPTLADIAFAVEMYYSGWIYRGYFTGFTITESSDTFLYTYDTTFMVTQRRGYRYNHLPWEKSANAGESNYRTPYSFDPTSKIVG